MFCPECGADHHVADRAAEAAADREVTIEKIHADRDIRIAQIEANVRRDVAETENALETAHAEGVAEGMQTVVDAATGDGQAPELAPDGAPIIVDAAAAAPEPEPEPALAPPVVEPSPSSSSRSGGNGWWSGYGRG